jgi:hypothetical protein
MTMPKINFALPLAAIAILALPAAAIAESPIPPGNSAVNQYTESLPTPGGHQDTERDKRGRGSPSKALGSRNAQRLEAQGSDGSAAAAAAAETTPTVDAASAPAADDEQSAAIAILPGDRNGNGGGGNATGRGAHSGGTGGANVIQVEESSGSSGFGEVLGEATGVSSAGQAGWLLPLLIFATALWALAYALRQRRRVS